MKLKIRFFLYHTSEPYYIATAYIWYLFQHPGLINSSDTSDFVRLPPIFIAPAYSRVRYRSSNFRPSVRSFVRPCVRSSVRPSTFTSKFSFLDIRDSCESETLQSNCPWHTLQVRTLTRCPWPIFHGPLTLKIFTSKFCQHLRRSLVFSPSEIAVSLKPCIVIVLDIPFKHAP